MDNEFERQMAEEVDELPHVRDEIGRHVKMQGSDAADEAHGGEQAGQAETVVAVHVGDENMVELADS